MEYQRHLPEILKKWFFKRKAIVLIGARQVGKTTMLTELVVNYGQPYLLLNGEEPSIKRLFDEPSKENFATIIGNNKVVFIDEAQQIKNIGLCLKIMVDNFKDVQFIASGSSALEIANEIFEPLTGRHLLFHLYPLSFTEVYSENDFTKAQQNLNWHLVHGLYPDTVNFKADAKTYLRSIANQYLYKDVLSWMDIRKPQLLENLMQLLAHQIASEVSINELAIKLKLKSATVESYLGLLEKSFVVYRLKSYATNERKEVTKMRKLYFWDLGIRNALINNFNPIELRSDTGALWENFLVTERLKNNAYIQSNANHFFWRSQQQQEIDYLEYENEKLKGYEMKWGSKVKITKAFSNNYPQAQVAGITQRNFIQFIKGEI